MEGNYPKSRRSLVPLRSHSANGYSSESKHTFKEVVKSFILRNDDEDSQMEILVLAGHKSGLSSKVVVFQDVEEEEQVLR